MNFQSLIHATFSAGLFTLSFSVAGHAVTATGHPEVDHAVSTASQPRADEKTWTTTTFLDFVDGTLTDGGVNSYVAADGTIRLINLRDLNDDGNIDIVLPNTHGHNEQMDLLIYWNKDEFSVDSRSQLPTNGGKRSTVADLNGDGYAELIVVNRFNSTKSELDSYIYWGSEQGFDVKHRSELPTRGGEAVAVGDLNRDGHPDLVFANSGLTYHNNMDKFNQSYIYWGSKDGYSKDRLSKLGTIHANDVEVADLNGDGFLDVVFANEGNTNSDGGAVVYWGNKNGELSEARSTHLPGQRSSAVAVADLNGDGIAEIVLANAFRLKSLKLEMYAFVETVALDSFVYWGSPEGYSAQRRTALPTVGAKDVAAEDLNGDGRPDIVFANQAGGASYVYWGGANGFHAHQRTALRTLGAAGCAVEDLNGDGHPDLVFANSNDGRNRRTDSYIYWGSDDGFASDRRAELPTWGATGIVVGDLNRDGKPDLTFTHEEDGTVTETVDSWIYWGDGGREFSPQRREALPTKGAYGYTAADLNNDGFVDVLIVGKESRLHWGGRRGYSKENSTVITTRYANAALAADFNRDGYLDLAMDDGPPWVNDTKLYWGGPNGFSEKNYFVFDTKDAGRLTIPSLGDLNRNGWLDIAFPTWSGKVPIYWNSSNSFDNQRKIELPCMIPGSSQVADLNQDGFLDLIVANKFDPNPPPGRPLTYGGDPETTSYVYWGGPKGYSPDRRLSLPTTGVLKAAVADLNNDGSLDLVFSSYHAGTTRKHPSFVYWNSSEGFDAKHVTMLPTNSAAGVMLADFDQDGHKDILFACHSKDGSHHNDSFLYWGNPDGYSPDRRSLIPGQGPHYLTPIDPGNVYDRSDHYDYVSPAFDGGVGVRFDRITWRGMTPFRTRLEFQVRTAAERDELNSAKWEGPKGPGSVFQTPGSKLTKRPKDHQWIQYKASLISPDSVNTPILDSVSVGYVR